jgi:hypothetical protein
MATPAIVLRKSRWTGARRFLGRLLLWRASVAWHLFLLLGIPLLFSIGVAWKGLLKRSSAEAFRFFSNGARLFLGQASCSASYGASGTFRPSC